MNVSGRDSMFASQTATVRPARLRSGGMAAGYRIDTKVA